MYDAKIYNDKIPSFVLAPMLAFTGSDCLLVKRRKTGATGNGQRANCHVNVQNWVDKKGGECVSGWLLQRHSPLINRGIWVWIFHSVWVTPEQKIVDVTLDPMYKDNDYITFWADKTRKADWKNGFSYNNIVIYQEGLKAKSILKEDIVDPQSGVIYWNTPDLQFIRRLDQHSGIYRHIKDEFPDNLKFLEEKYNAVRKDGELVAISGSLQLDSEILFDTSISIQT